ncbi:MAG: NYN domain-containing protein, partial [Candidatus Scalindua sediminis]
MTNEAIARFRQRLGIFVDVQNMFYSAKALHQSKIDYSKLLQEIVAKRDLVRAVAYVVHKSDVDQSSFTDALKRLGYEIKTKELRLRPDGTAKGDWDMGIAIDTIGMAPKLDTVVLVTGDG